MSSPLSHFEIALMAQVTHEYDYIHPVRHSHMQAGLLQPPPRLISQADIRGLEADGVKKQAFMLAPFATAQKATHASPAACQASARNVRSPSPSPLLSPRRLPRDDNFIHRRAGQGGGSFALRCCCCLSSPFVSFSAPPHMIHDARTRTPVSAALFGPARGCCWRGARG